MILSTQTLQRRAVVFHWKAALLILTLSWAAVLCLFRQTLSSMVSSWQSSTFSHGFLILPMSLYLAWSCRSKVAQRATAPFLWGIPILGAVAFGWLMGYIANVSLVQHAALVLILQVLTWTILGTRIIRTLLFPVLYLFFAVPLGDSLTPPLQDFTASFVVQVLQVSGIPVLQEGRLITVPSGVWQVAEACSGLRYLLSSLAFGCFCSGLLYRGWRRRIGFFSIFLFVPILANGVRAYTVVMLTDIGGRNRVAGYIARFIETMNGHLIYGWLCFLLLMMFLFWLGLRWPEQPDVDHRRVEEVPADTNAAFSLVRVMLSGMAGILVVAFVPSATLMLTSSRDSATEIALPRPSIRGTWTRLPMYAQQWTPHFARPAKEIKESYQVGDRLVHLYAGYYLNETNEPELVSSSNTLVNRTEDIIVSEGSRVMAIDGKSVSVRDLLIRSEEGTRLVWTWYWVAGTFTSNPYYVKFLEAEGRLCGTSARGAVFVLSTDGSRPSEASASLNQFSKDILYQPDESGSLVRIN